MKCKWCDKEVIYEVRDAITIHTDFTYWCGTFWEKPVDFTENMEHSATPFTAKVCNDCRAVNRCVCEKETSNGNHTKNS